MRDYFLPVYLRVLISIFQLKGCYDVIKEEVIKERNRFDAFTNDILTGGFRVVLVMVGISLIESFLTSLINKLLIALSKSYYIKTIKVPHDRYGQQIFGIQQRHSNMIQFFSL